MKIAAVVAVAVAVVAAVAAAVVVVRERGSYSCSSIQKFQSLQVWDQRGSFRLSACFRRFPLLRYSLVVVVVAAAAAAVAGCLCLIQIGHPQ